MSVTMLKYSESCTTRVLSENILKYLNVHIQILCNPKNDAMFLIMNQTNENAKCQMHLTNFSDHQDLFHVYTLSLLIRKYCENL